MNEKKFRKSGIAIACYVLAAALLVYVCYLAGNTVAQINQYYAQYGMTAKAGEYFTYILQSVMQPAINAILLFMLGYILDTVRKNDPANYLSDEEIAAKAAAKKEAREARKIAKGEAAAAKNGSPASDETSVEADFAESLDKALKAEEKKAPYNKKTNHTTEKKSGNKSGSGKKKSAEGGEAKGGENRKPESRTEGKKSSSRSGANKSGGSNKGGQNRSGSGSRQSRKKPDQVKPKADQAAETKSDVRPNNEDATKKDSGFTAEVHPAGEE